LHKVYYFEKGTVKKAVDNKYHPGDPHNILGLEISGFLWVMNMKGWVLFWKRKGLFP
jgi:hypothetical protein